MTNQEIKQYLVELQNDEFEFKNRNGSVSDNVGTSESKDIWRPFKLGWFLLRCSADYIALLFKLRFPHHFSTGIRFVFTARNLCTEIDGVLEDRIVKPLFSDGMVFVNHSKEYYLKRINGQKVYNVGGVFKLVRKKGLAE